MVVPDVVTTAFWLILFAFITTTFIFGIRIHMNQQQQKEQAPKLERQTQQEPQETVEDRKARVELIKQRGWW
ncbi:hypothetical protein [Fischerella sp. PCC 9605]|uniref:hypothetical protein n=1 Tax=Fischerella sp. PCC 9605 TaxID=1173024 RepID=UPI00047A6F4B|nr:hypothetical protein [Fischerella sp. PCC 9605]